jgi:N-acetylglucosamine-6-sulfatase
MGVLRQAGVGVGLVAALVALAGTGTPTASGAPEPAPSKPNIVVLMSDDQTAASQSVMTKTNSLIGAQGATFNNNFTNWPLCCPSRATFMTGQYAHNHTVLGNAPPFGGFDRLDTSETLPVWLQRDGYYTAQIGKFLNGYEDSDVQVPPGWSEWHGTKRTYTYYGEQLLEDGQVVTYGSTTENPDNPADPAAYSTDLYTAKAVDIINRQAPSDQPFFLYVAYLAPHAGGPNKPANQPQSQCEDTAKPAARDLGHFAGEPLPTPPNFNEADVSDKPAGIASRPFMTDEQIANDTRKYRCRLESLLAVDQGVSNVMAALQASGELDNTLVIYTSDNGFFAGEHRVLTGKNRVYEEAIRVPLEMRGPGIPAGVTVDDLAINADLAPTIIEAAGATAGRVEDGESLLNFTRHPERRHGRELLIEQYGNSPDEEGQAGITYTAIRTTRYKYVANGTGEIELYDLQADPYELNNLHANPDYAAAEAALASRLASLQGCSGQTCHSHPSLALTLPKSVVSHGSSCRPPKDFVARVHGSGAGAVTELTFSVGTQAAGRVTAKPLEKRILPRLLRSGDRPEIRAMAELVDGREYSLQQRVRICA